MQCVRATKHTEAAVNRFKNALEEDDLSSRAYKRIIEEVIEIIEHLKKMQNTSTKHPQNERGEENPTMAKILQEIKTIITAIKIAQGSFCTQVQSWTKVISKSEIATTTIRIQDEEEKKEVAKLSSKELVDKIGMKEVIGARKMINGQVKIFFTEDETRQIMEKQRDWTQKLAPTAHIACKSYQVLTHDMPLNL